MDLNSIPKSFWHSASFSIVALTLGFLFISFKFGDLSIKFKDLAVQTSDTIALKESLVVQQESIDGQAKTIKERELKIINLESALEKRLRELNDLKEELVKLQNDQHSAIASGIEAKINLLTTNTDFDENISETLLELSSLEDKQSAQHQTFQQQQVLFNNQQQQQQQRSIGNQQQVQQQR